MHDNSNELAQSNKSPKAQRVVGGLIFTRPNLPVKQDIKIKYIPKDEE